MHVMYKSALQCYTIVVSSSAVFVGLLPSWHVNVQLVCFCFPIKEESQLNGKCEKIHYG